MPEMTQMVTAPAPRGRATSENPEETMVMPTRRKRPENVMGVGRKVTSREIADQFPTRLPEQHITTTKEPETTGNVYYGQGRMEQSY